MLENIKMEGAHLFDLPPEVIVKILMELDEQSLGLFKCVCRYVNSLIERHRTSLVRQTIYAAVFKEDELIVERYLKRNRWIENKYSISHSLLDPTIIRQLICADIATVKFQVNMPDELAIHLAHHISKFKLDVFRVCFVKCRLSIKAINELLLALKPQLVTIEFDENFNGITIKEFSKYDGFKEVKSLELFNSLINDDDLQLINTRYLMIYEASHLTLQGIRRILLDWYNGKRIIHIYNIRISERITPDDLFIGLPIRRRSLISWEIKNSNGFVLVSIIGLGVSIVKLFEATMT